MKRSLCFLTLLLAGCADAQLFRRPTSPPVGFIGPVEAASYRIGCPDVLSVAFAEKPEWDCVASVDVDGHLPLGDAGRPAVEGLSLDAARDEIASSTGTRVTLELADARSGRVYVSGPENNRHRVVPYRGPERAVEFLWRVGAVKQGCTDLQAVSVLRPNIAAGRQPEVFEVDVAAVVLDGDHSTNVLLQASDKVIVGETRRSAFSRLLPDWYKPLYRKLVGMLPPDGWPWGR